MAAKKKPTRLVKALKEVMGKSAATQKTGDPLEVSQGTIKNWRNCHAMYDYRYVQLIRRKRPIVQLIRGTMLGKIIDAQALQRIEKKAPAWQTAIEPFKKQYGRYFQEEQEYYGDILGEVARIGAKYQQVYANDGLTYSGGIPGAPKGQPPYEFPIRVDIAPGIVFTGHLDKLPIDRQGRTWDMDHKSHKNIPEPEDRYVDLQQVFYQWAAPLSGYVKLAGVIWDYVRTKPPTLPEELKKGGLSQRKNIDTTWEVYEGEIKRLGLNPKDYIEMRQLLEPRGQMDFFLRVQLPAPSPKLVENVVSEARTTAIEIKRFGGVDKTRSVTRDCKRCEFFNLCMAEFRGLDSSYIRKSEYEVNPEPRHAHVMGED